MIKNKEKEIGKILFRDWTPTSDNINNLPKTIKKFIYNLETNVDPAGTVAENEILKDVLIIVIKFIDDKVTKKDSTHLDRDYLYGVIMDIKKMISLKKGSNIK